MARLFAWLVLACVSARGAAAGSAFMIVSGVSSPFEMCLAVDGGNVDTAGAEVSLTSCSSAVSAGDGREVFTMQPNGQIANAVSKLCLALADNDVTDGGRLALTGCDLASKPGDGRSVFELAANGQLKFARDGDYCVGQRGPAVGFVDAAIGSAVSATSSANNAAHGARAAVDGDKRTYWASKPGDVGAPVELVIDFGSAVKLERLDVDWEFPAKSFSIALSEDGLSFQEVFATDVNVLNSTSASVGSRYARKAKVVMTEPHPLFGRSHGRWLYGISSLRFESKSLRAVAEKCSLAAQSADARDKYFLNYVADAEFCAAKAVASELPALGAAEASLAAAVSELEIGASRVNDCSSGSRASALAARGSAEKRGRAAAGRFNARQTDLLLAAARKQILLARR